MIEATGRIVLSPNFQLKIILDFNARCLSSQVNTLPKAKSKTRRKQNKDMHKCSSVYSERGVPLPVLTSGGE